MTPLCHDGRESHFSLFYEIKVLDVLSRMQLLELSEPSQPLFKATFTNLSGMIDKNKHNDALLDIPKLPFSHNV